MKMMITLNNKQKEARERNIKLFIDGWLVEIFVQLGHILSYKVEVGET